MMWALGPVYNPNLAERQESLAKKNSGGILYMEKVT
jgi:hypothetical protein